MAFSSRCTQYSFCGTVSNMHYVDFLKLRKVNMSQGVLRAGEAV
jgi:hypothetical protein